MKTITKKEVLIRSIIICLVMLFAFTSEDYNRQLINTFGLLLAFGVSLYLHKHFFPLFIGAIFFYLLAAGQELWSEDYKYLTITRFYWTAGNILLPLGIFDFAYRLMFKYKIVEND